MDGCKIHAIRPCATCLRRVEVDVCECRLCVHGDDLEIGSCNYRDAHEHKSPTPTEIRQWRDDATEWEHEVHAGRPYSMRDEDGDE